MKQFFTKIKGLFKNVSKTQFFAIAKIIIPFLIPQFPILAKLMPILESPEVLQALQILGPATGAADIALRKVTKDPLTAGVGLAGLFVKDPKAKQALNEIGSVLQK